jgi:glycosyltransferase involved in cell wall biosynthesis
MKLKVYYYGGESAVNDDSGFGQKVTWDIPLLDGYDYVFLKNASNSTGMNTRFFDAINWSIFNVLRKSEDKVVIVNGWAYVSDWFVLITAKLYGKKVWMRGEMPWNQENMKPDSFKKRIKYFVLKKIVFKFFIDKFLYIGSQNKEYYKKHGVQDSRLIYGPYSVDNNRFQLHVTDMFEVRKKWGIPEDCVIVLFSGKLIEKKRPLDLLQAVHQINNAKIFLFFMGDGPLRKMLTSYMESHAVRNVIISGFINQSEIGEIYSIADIFVMCSGLGETWGLSVNEAMNFSMPVVVSATCGCSYDLVNAAENGFVFKEGDIDTLKKQICELVHDVGMRERMGKSSKEKINNFTHHVTCTNIKDALNA